MVTKVEANPAARQEDSSSKENLSPPKEFLGIEHFYQPTRRILTPDGKRVEVLPFVNDDILRQCYKPMLARNGELPDALAFSFYPTLWLWMKDKYPDDFAIIKGKIEEMADREYRILGDTYIHAILPLLPPEDQEILIKAGKKASIEEFGFDRKGLWLPETAVSTETLKIAAQNGYEFVPLGRHQIEPASSEPVRIAFEGGLEIIVLPFESEISKQLSFNEWARMNADTFLKQWVPYFASKPHGNNTVIACDGETFGHHDKNGVAFREYLYRPEVLAQHGYKSLSIKEQLNNVSRYAEIHELTSWSDYNDHKLGRWRGECCGNTAEEGKYLFRRLQEQNTEINAYLNNYYPNWKEEFISLIVNLRNEILAGGNIMGQLENNIKDYTKLRIFAAKIYTLLGFTSCGWFFDKKDSPEREIPRQMTIVVGKLLRDEYRKQHEESTIFAAV